MNSSASKQRIKKLYFPMSRHIHTVKMTLHFVLRLVYMIEEMYIIKLILPGKKHQKEACSHMFVN